jgi:hypothetical protein
VIFIVVAAAVVASITRVLAQASGTHHLQLCNHSSSIAAPEQHPADAILAQLPAYAHDVITALSGGTDSLAPGPSFEAVIIVMFLFHLHAQIHVVGQGWLWQHVTAGYLVVGDWLLVGIWWLVFGLSVNTNLQQCCWQHTYRLLHNQQRHEHAEDVSCCHSFCCICMRVCRPLGGGGFGSVRVVRSIACWTCYMHVICVTLLLHCHVLMQAAG